ncbi:MAG: SelB C-terminal domain-containing protein, partial [Deltaproteobacteria bacterium]|nr:SelB C-terminal domain-containing protein [Deltaproteobacteria bacterium]
SGLGARICKLLAEQGIEPPTIKELAEATCSSEKDLRDHLAVLTREGRVTRVSGDIFYDSGVLKALEEKLIAHLRAKSEIIPAEFRELTGLSRKFMIPLLEYFDSRKVTIRVGD